MAYFFEIQRFIQLWLRMLVILDAIFIWIFTVLMFTGRIANATNQSLGITAFVFVLCGMGIPLLLILSSLKTVVSKEGISVLFIPFHSKEKVFAFTDIQSIEAREYRPIAEYGGWGLRKGLNGLAYNVSGNKGIQIILRNGEKILIGTQQPKEFMQAIQKAKAAS